MPLQPRQHLQLDVDKLAFGGAGVARHEGVVVFVERGLPGQAVEAEITKVKKRHAFATVRRVLEPSPHEVDPECPHFPECGGCTHLDLDYAQQLQWKGRHVRDALVRLAGARDVEVAPAAPSPELRGFRNKMEFSFQDREGGGQIVGLRQREQGSRVMEVPHCLLPAAETLAVLETASQAARDLPGSAFDPAGKRGFWRRLVVRQSRATGEIMVHLITAGLPQYYPAARELLERLRAEHPRTVCAVHSLRNNARDAAAGEKELLRLGEDAIEEELAGMRLRIPPRAFFQTNTAAAEVLCETLLDAARLQGPETVYDLYCGVGALTLPLARAARQPAGLDVSEEAVAAARENAALNNLVNCPFHAVNLKQARQAFSRLPPPDAVIADPPRAGMHENLLRELLAERPRTILYVSCNPPTMARDLKPLLEHYRLVSARPVDLFPHSPHVEMVVRLEAEG